jgi:hypothetical protein
MDDIEKIKIEEYRSLLEEHRRDRSYIFERPLLILGIIAFAMRYFYESDTDLLVLIGLITIVIFCFNLWFTVNRLQSDARIVAYIQLVHEGGYRERWFGWENALREYRILMGNDAKSGVLNSMIADIQNGKFGPASSNFYKVIWILHISLVIFICAASLLSLLPFEALLEKIEACAILAAAILFIGYAFGPLRPARLKNRMELERKIWESVFEEYES